MLKRPRKRARFVQVGRVAAVRRDGIPVTFERHQDQHQDLLCRELSSYLWAYMAMYV